MKKPSSLILSLVFLLAIVPVIFPVCVVAQEEATAVYTCSMHPQVRLPNPGSCPICSMPLIRAQSSNNTTDRPEVGTLKLSKHALAMASVETVVLDKRPLSHVVNAVGKISFDETALATITARVDGYAERLFVNFTGVEVKKGDHLVEVYSPGLVVAQQELLVAGGGSRSELLETTKIKLRRLGLTAEQVEEVATKKKVTERITLLSPITGTVIARNVTQNASFKAGDILYQIANLETVWAYIDIYESQLPWLRYGQHVTMKTEAFPGRSFDGLVTFISPIVDDASRTIKIPVHITNKDQALKPGMFVSADIHAALDVDGGPAPTGAEGSYTCPMHPQVLQTSAGSCPICGMDLKRVPGEKTADSRKQVLAIPSTAVLDSGKRRLVYVETAPGTYESRDVELGSRAGDFYPVLKGLQEGERVAVRGNFLLDSQAQISGSASLFYPQGAGAAPVHHGQSGSDNEKTVESKPPEAAHKH